MKFGDLPVNTVFVLANAPKRVFKKIEVKQEIYDKDVLQPHPMNAIDEYGKMEWIDNFVEVETYESRNRRGNRSGRSDFATVGG